MQKIKDYIDRFFKSRKINEYYTLRTGEVMAFIHEMRSADGDTLFHSVATLFRYGYIKGYRAAKAEMKKGGAA